MRRRLNPGQKANITKAFRTIKRHRTATFVPLARLSRREQRRLKELGGTKGTAVSGAFLDVPKDARVRVVKGQLEVTHKKTREIHIPLDKDLFIKNALTQPRQIIRDFKPLAIGAKYGTWRGPMYRSDVFDMFYKDLVQTRRQYKNIGDFLTGYVIRVRALSKRRSRRQRRRR